MFFCSFFYFLLFFLLTFHTPAFNVVALCSVAIAILSVCISSFIFLIYFFFFAENNMKIYNNSNNNENKNKQTSRYNFNKWMNDFFFFSIIFIAFATCCKCQTSIREVYLVLLLASISFNIAYKFLVSIFFFFHMVLHCRVLIGQTWSVDCSLGKPNQHLCNYLLLWIDINSGRCLWFEGVQKVKHHVSLLWLLQLLCSSSSSQLIIVKQPKLFHFVSFPFLIFFVFFFLFTSMRSKSNKFENCLIYN